MLTRWEKIKASLPIRTCRYCGKKFRPSSGVALTCKSCLTARPFCACGCRRRVQPIGSSGGKPNKFLRGHSNASHTGQGHVYWKNLNEETKVSRAKKISKTVRGLWASRTDEERAKIAKKSINAASLKPNTKERQLDELLTKKFPSQFRLNVKGGMTLGGKIPDFVNVNGKKVVVELFGNHWHELSEEAYRRRCFAKYGFRTVVIWESILKDESKVISLVRKGLEGR